MKTNPVVWFEIYVQDMRRAQAFYERVFQCKLAPMKAPEGIPPDTHMMAFPGDDMTTYGATGMLIKMDGVPSGGGGSLVYFSCDDCAVEQARVEAAGGQINKSKASIEPYGFIALVVDTEGNCIGLHSMK
ncbi:MAG: VOC family protein [Burkholderiaceae bacterium]|jgi:predicted enzyme related to lactoylglutathione lyase|nr:MAG: VOC family protein [Burkholderiaceae bacterium]